MGPARHGRISQLVERVNWPEILCLGDGTWDSALCLHADPFTPHALVHGAAGSALRRFSLASGRRRGLLAWRVMLGGRAVSCGFYLQW